MGEDGSMIKYDVLSDCYEAARNVADNLRCSIGEATALSAVKVK